MKHWSLVLLLLTACKGGSSTSSAPAGSGSAGSAAAPVVFAPAAPLAVAADAPPPVDASLCKPKCLYAAELPLAEAIAKHATECKADWYAADDCEGLLYGRNCIYARYGNVFKTAAWKDRFTKEPWYQPNATFSEQDIPAFAMANIVKLKKQYEACVAPAPAVTPEDQKLAADTYERVIAREESADGIDPDELASARDSLRNLRVDEKTTYGYDAVPKDGRRTITMSGLYHAVGGGEFQPDASATLTFDGGKLVEIR